MLKNIIQKGYLRNLDLSLVAIVIIAALFFMPETPQNVGMLAQILSFVTGYSVSIAVSIFAHRQIFKDLRPHLFTPKDGEKISSWQFEMILKASNHRLIWCLSSSIIYVAWWIFA